MTSLALLLWIVSGIVLQLAIYLGIRLLAPLARLSSLAAIAPWSSTCRSPPFRL
jgi:hypothetical protein